MTQTDSKTAAKPPLRRRILKLKPGCLIPLVMFVVSLAVLIFIALLLPRHSFVFEKDGDDTIIRIVRITDPDAEEEPPAEDTLVNVEVLRIEAVPQLADTLLQPAVVEPNRVVDIAAEVEGRIEKIRCDEGQRCKPGDVLIELNTELLQAQFEGAKAQAEFDAKQAERAEALLKEGVATDEDRDDARARMAVSAAALQSTRARLDRARIVSKVEGVVDHLPVEQGEYVQPGTLVARIVDVDTVKVVVNVPERDIKFFEEGSEHEIVADVRGVETSLAGRITFISRLADSQTLSTRVEITLDNSEGQLFSGQIVRAKLTRRILSNVIMIPLSAVIPLEDSKAVYVIEGDVPERDAPPPAASDGRAAVARRREVALGIIRGRSVQVQSGLEAGDLLIVAGHRFVGPGQLVRVQNAFLDAADTTTSKTSREN